MIRKSTYLSRKVSFRQFGAVLGAIVRLLTLANSQAPSNALLDAIIPPDGEPPIMELENTNWVILRKKLTWGEASAICDKKYFRLAKLGTKEKAQELVDKIESISEKYTPEYEKKYMEIEFGMDRRYWIGLTDQIEDGKWYWTHDGSELTYDFWYPDQPDHKKATDNSREHCVTLWNPGYFYDTYNKHTFNDEECLNTNYAICDKTEEAATTNPDPSAAGPSPAEPPPPATDPSPPVAPAPDPSPPPAPDPGSS